VFVRVVARRLLSAVITVFGVSVVIFLVAQLAGDPVAIMMSGTNASLEDIQRMRRQLGYEDPLPVQYARYVGNALRGDLGVSLRYQRPVGELVVERIVVTAELAVSAMVLAAIAGLPLGILAAARARSVADRLVMVISLSGQSVPLFWLGIVLIQLIVVQLHLLPVGGWGGGDPRYLVLPALTLATFPLSRIARLTRSAMLDEILADYVRTARSKGLGARTVLYGHVLRNALLPVITVMGLQFGTLLGGAVVTETVFAWPGLGLLSVQAALARDMPLLQAIALLASLTFVLVNLLVDLLYTRLDPRIQYS
jgi:peptide/nickel transport system permease protein